MFCLVTYVITTDGLPEVSRGPVVLLYGLDRVSRHTHPIEGVIFTGQLTAQHIKVPREGVTTRHPRRAEESLVQRPAHSADTTLCAVQNSSR